MFACRRSGDRIHHLYTVFDERNPDATGNRYLICFTSEKQAKKKPVIPPKIADTHDEGPVFSEDEEAPAGKKLRKGGPYTYQLRLVHGFHRGTSLRSMIQDEYRYHEKVLRIMPGDNPGITILVLKELY